MSADDARGVGRGDGPRGLRVAFGELSVQREEPTWCCGAGEERLPHAGRWRRRERQVGERGAQVEASAADHDRRAAGAERRIDLLVRERGMLGHRPRALERQEPDEAMLELRALSGGRLGRDERQPVVDLQRVDTDRDRRLAATPERVTERDRDGRLADRGRPEDRENGRCHAPSIAGDGDGRSTGRSVR